MIIRHFGYRSWSVWSHSCTDGHLWFLLRTAGVSWQKLRKSMSSWRRDDYLPMTLPPWGDVQAALTSVMQTWLPSQDDINTGRRCRNFPVSAGEYVSLRGVVTLTSTLGNVGGGRPGRRVLWWMTGPRQTSHASVLLRRTTKSLAGRCEERNMGRGRGAYASALGAYRESGCISWRSTWFCGATRKHH